MNETFQKLQQIYTELAQEISTLERKPRCFNCGACCNFNYFDHIPFLTALEILHIQVGLTENRELHEIINQQTDENLCPFFLNQSCQAHELRPLSCRVYFCNLTYEKHQASEIYEKYHRKIQQLHEKSGIKYKYMPLVSNLRKLLK